MQKTKIYKYLFAVTTLLTVGVLTSCFYIGRDYAKPDRRYYGVWNDTIRKNCSEAYDDDCQNEKPEWSTPRKVYSVLPPKGKWEINDVFSEKNANYKFYYYQNKYVSYYIEIGAYPVSWGKKRKRLKEVLEQGSFKEEAKRLPEVEKSRYGSGVDIRINLIDVVSVKDNKCMKLGWTNHEGPSPDPVKSSAHSGLGRHVNTTRIACYLRGPHEFWKFSIEYEYEIMDAALDNVDREDVIVTPGRAQRDLEMRMQRFMDSIKFYGLGQNKRKISTSKE